MHKFHPRVCRLMRTQSSSSVTNITTVVRVAQPTTYVHTYYVHTTDILSRPTWESTNFNRVMSRTIMSFMFSRAHFSDGTTKNSCPIPPSAWCHEDVELDPSASWRPYAPAAFPSSCPTDGGCRLPKSSTGQRPSSWLMRGCYCKCPKCSTLFRPQSSSPCDNRHRCCTIAIWAR